VICELPGFVWMCDGESYVLLNDGEERARVEPVETVSVGPRWRVRVGDAVGSPVSLPTAKIVAESVAQHPGKS
jgi:hypothetical protein